MFLLCVVGFCVAELALCIFFLARKRLSLKSELLEAKTAMGRFRAASNDDDRQREIMYSGKLILRSSLSALAVIALIFSTVALPLFLSELLFLNLGAYFIAISFWTIVLGITHWVVDRKKNDLRPS
jgi:hypothetical protein